MTAPCLGCAFSLGATPAATIDTQGKPGAEGRIDASAAGGNNDIRMVLSAHGGGGYLGGLSSGYGMVAAHLGAATGADVRLSAGPTYVARFMSGEANGPRHAFGGCAAAAFRVTDLGEEDAAWYLGPRIQGEHLWGRDGEHNRGLFSLGLEARWVFLDFTRNFLKGSFR